MKSPDCLKIDIDEQSVPSNIKTYIYIYIYIIYIYIYIYIYIVCVCVQFVLGRCPGPRNMNVNK